MDIQNVVSDLHKSGYFSDKQHLCGFSISTQTEGMDPHRIFGLLKTKWLGRHICCFHELNSTNDFAQKLASFSAPDGTAVLTDFQTAGRGRAGRLWQASPARGLLFSFLLYPRIAAEKVPLLTLATAVGVSRALVQTTGVEVGIKWPNDLIVKKKKLGGILSEARFEGKHPNHVICGVGININSQQHEWSEDIRATAISLHQATGLMYDRDVLFAAICNECEQSYNQILHGRRDAVLNDWIQYSVTLGKEITVHTHSGEFQAVASGISSDGALVIRKPDGEEKKVYMGDISIRHIDGGLTDE
jgi:BirA family biotin operon repressor/biotin-[acetyl-CoA-carboxylase] ligase